MVKYVFILYNMGNAMRTGLFILGIMMLNWACDPGVTPSDSSTQETIVLDTEALRAEAETLTEDLGRSYDKIINKKNSIEKNLRDYAQIGDADLKTKSELLFEARIAEALISDEIKGLDEDRLKRLEAQAKGAESEDKDLVAKLRKKFDKTKEELARIKAIRQDLQNKENAVVNKSFALAPLADFKNAHEKITKAKIKIDHAIQTLSALANADDLKNAVADMEAATEESDIKTASQRASQIIATLTASDAPKIALDNLRAAVSEADLRRTAEKAGLDPQVIEAALKGGKEDPAQLISSLRKVAESIKSEQVQQLKDAARIKAHSPEVINAKSKEDAVDQLTALLQAHVISLADPLIRTKIINNANDVIDFKPSLGFFDKSWSTSDKNIFLSKIANFTSLLVKNSYAGLARAIADFQSSEPTEATMKRVKDQLGNLGIKLDSLFTNLREAKFELEKNQAFLDVYINLQEKASKAEGLVEAKIEKEIGAGRGPFNTPEDIKDAAKRVIEILGKDSEDRINAIFVKDLEGQKKLLVKDAEIIKRDLEHRLQRAKILNSEALRDFTTALSELAAAKKKSPSAKDPAAGVAQKDMAKFLLQANINKLVELLKEPKKYNENAKLMNLVAQDLSTRVSNRGELREALSITDEPLPALIQELEQQKTYWNYQDSDKLFPKALNYIITALKILLTKKDHTKTTVRELVILQNNLSI